MFADDIAALLRDQERFVVESVRSKATGEIAAAVKRLGAERFAERQEASDFLWQAGKAA